MGSKKFKDKRCAYCFDCKAVTGDHVFARGFFLPEHRHNLPKVPSCIGCNNHKSKLEHYLTTLLPFAAKHKYAEENLTRSIPKRLHKNKQLFNELSKSVSEKKVGLVLPVREGILEELFEMIVKGLAWYHWETNLFKSNIEVTCLTKAGEQFYQNNFFSLVPKNKVRGNLGSGTVIYEGIQGFDCSQITVWRFHMYGGMVMGEDTRNSDLISKEIGVLSYKEEMDS